MTLSNGFDMGESSPVKVPEGPHLGPNRSWRAIGPSQTTCLPSSSRYRPLRPKKTVAKKAKAPVAIKAILKTAAKKGG
jgi:hypothetical protein